MPHAPRVHMPTHADALTPTYLQVVVVLPSYLPLTIQDPASEGLSTEPCKHDAVETKHKGEG